ncbi:MAG: hypothetical protein IKT32_07930, partial [Clostridia bacterium]|nr:hypothetical protein [Clostridia bacterium]
MKAIKKHFIATLAVLATVATSLAGVLFKAPVTTNAAEGELFSESFTFAEAVGAISYTEEELTATGMTLSGGVLGGATSSLTAEQLAVKETFYKTAYGRSPLKYYMAYRDAYVAKEYWQWAIDKSNSWKFSWAHIGGLSAGHNGTTASRINAGENHTLYNTADYNYTFAFVYVAPVDGKLTISQHTLGVDFDGVSTNKLKVGYAKVGGAYATLSPTDSTLGWVEYAEGTGSSGHIIPAQTFEMTAGEMVYISMYSPNETCWIYYNPSFSFVEKSTEVEETQTKDFAIDFEDATDAS